MNQSFWPPTSPRDARAWRPSRRREAHVRERHAADVYRQPDFADGEEKVTKGHAKMKMHPLPPASEWSLSLHHLASRT